MTVINRYDNRRCGAFAGLALLLTLPAVADESLRQTIRKQMRDENYILIEDQSGARLYVLPPGDPGFSVEYVAHAPGSTALALAKTQSAMARERVRGLTELSGSSSEEALAAALRLLSDPVDAVREEAVQLALEHPETDRSSLITIALNDPSRRVREAVLELLEDEAEDGEHDARRPH